MRTYRNVRCNYWEGKTRPTGGGGGGGRGLGLVGSRSKVQYCRTPDSGSGLIPTRGKAKGAGGLDTKSMEAFTKILNQVR